MKNKYYEDDRVLIPQYILDMSDEEAELLMKKQKKMNKMHKKAMKKKNINLLKKN